MSEHVIATESSFLTSGHHAVCSCGWKGEHNRPTAEEAVRDGEAHAQEASSKPLPLAEGMILMDPDDYGRPRVWIVKSARTLIYHEAGVCVKATLHTPGLPEGWKVIPNSHLARMLAVMLREGDKPREAD